MIRLSQIEIVEEPLKKIVLFGVAKYPTPTALAKTLELHLMAGMPVALKWAEGVLMKIKFLQSAEYIVKREVEDRVMFVLVDYTLMPQYNFMIAIGKMNVGVEDGTLDKEVVALANYLKSRRIGEE